MVRRTHKRGARLPLPWEREGSSLLGLLSGRRVWPLLAFVGASSLVAGTYLLGGRRADLRATRALLGEVEHAAHAFVSDIGRCPRNTRELMHPPRSGVHYLSEPPIDAWGHQVHLRCVQREQGKTLEIEATSAGASGSFLKDDNVL
jgi:hypothetical protein